MNPVFWLLVVFVLALLWFLLSFAFKGIGSFFKSLWDDAKEEMNDQEE